MYFTGFGTDDEKKRLADEAAAAGFHVASSVTKTLDYLVCGPMPGPAKLKQAEGRGAKIIPHESYLNLLKGMPAQA